MARGVHQGLYAYGFHTSEVVCFHFMVSMLQHSCLPVFVTIAQIIYICIFLRRTTSKVVVVIKENSGLCGYLEAGIHVVQLMPSQRQLMPSHFIVQDL